MRPVLAPSVQLRATQMDLLHMVPATALLLVGTEALAQEARSSPAPAPVAVAAEPTAPVPPPASGPDLGQVVGTITVWIVDPAGPRAGAPAKLVVRRADGNGREMSLTTGPSGFVRIRGAPSVGVLELRVETEGAAPQWVPPHRSTGWVTVLRRTSVEGMADRDSLPPIAPIAAVVARRPAVRAPVLRDPETPTLDAGEGYDLGAALQTAGVALTLLGATALALGSVLWVSELCRPFDPTCHSDATPGKLVTVGGIFGLGAGISLVVIGGHEKRQAEREGYVPPRTRTPPEGASATRCRRGSVRRPRPRARGRSRTGGGSGAP
jgi:hypothetical protein